ncbi:homoserine O-acetyltransferase MetA [Oceanobacillus alkalisoli]|uniref:homoserine O-acetyltransferase MetA n=1 Tax=Oceanobacillus alkalisoli TaxID=2925113 RepID=UPI001EF0AD75|nr:homoserine O-succinyltransferase [Oceanobacillus alkalisoli]MCF3944394.1 homoserine O-succinyltransferase [Oceanobacillus alkalisoli]MCG5102145.1 homoserine O-succinyltransferase [Oceanobacillus alkalisoli]
MPINIPRELPARETLKEEKIFVMEEDRARTQDIRPLNILILNLMPEKEKTELQLLRLLGNTPLQVNITFLRTATYQSKNVSNYHLDTFYTTFDKIKSRKFDGLIITGAPIEHLEFEEVNYWRELQQIMDWSVENVTSNLYICWGAQAALYHHYGIEKEALPEKYFGIFNHDVSLPTEKLVQGFNDNFFAPHSRHTTVSLEAIEEHPELSLLSKTDENSPFIILSKDRKNIMITGHLEYDATTLRDEYERDMKKGFEMEVPVNYFPDDDPEKPPLNLWRSHTHLLFSNWLNYYVYQETPYHWN